jgi:hypothetical protein
MKIINIKVTFEDIFSGAKEVKECTRSEETFKQMIAGIGSIVKRFENGINYQWKVIKVEQI